MKKKVLAIVSCISYYIHCFLLIYFLPPLLHLLFMCGKSKSGQLSSSAFESHQQGKCLRMAKVASSRFPGHISACQNKFQTQHLSQICPTTLSKLEFIKRETVIAWMAEPRKNSTIFYDTFSEPNTSIQRSQYREPFQ